ncbi:MAG: hypothetical protein AAGC71_16915 [Pseudomonadota bacterium]
MTEPKKHSFIQLRRLVIEFTVIVTGVLVALIAEAWWSEREDRTFEKELREDMVEEFQTNLTILEADLKQNYSVIARLNRFADLSDDELLALPESALATWASGDLDWAGFDPMRGSAAALVRSGNIGAIADRDLRLRLSTWSGLLDEKSRFTGNAVTFQSLVFNPSAARLGADEIWTADERRELRSNLRWFKNLMQAAIENQERLSTAAKEMTDYLQR